MTKKTWAITITVGIVLLCVISGAASYVSHQTLAESLRVVFGSVGLLFVPGYVWSWVCFPRRTNDDAARRGLTLDIIERGLLAVALSMILTPLALFLLSIFGIKITLLTIISSIAGLTVLGAIVLWIGQRKK